jgi:hypothetical protein
VRAIEVALEAGAVAERALHARLTLRAIFRTAKGAGGIGDADGCNDGCSGNNDVFFLFGYFCSYCSSGERINLQRQRFV